MIDLRRDRADVLALVLLAAGFFALYLAIGEAYRTLPGYSEYSNVFFGADHRDALRGWVANHKGSHPLLLLFVVPLTSLFGWFAPSYESGLVVFAACLGAVTVSAFFLLVRLMTTRTLVAAGIATVFGLSMSQLVFAAIPESYELSAAGLIATYLLTFWCLSTRKLHWPLWLLAGLLTIGSTITNVMQAFICLAVVLGSGVARGRRVRLLVAFPLLVLGIAAVLALIQKGLFPTAKLFFVPQSVQYEFYYLSAEIFENPRYVLEEIFKSFFLFDVVGQQPLAEHFRPGVRVVMVYTGAAVRYGWLAWLTVALWIGLLVRGLVLGLRHAESRPMTVAAGLAVLANMILHATYGTDESFLYTAHFLFAVVLLAVSERSTRGLSIAVLWWLLAALVGVNNLGVVRNIFAAFGA